MEVPVTNVTGAAGMKGVTRIYKAESNGYTVGVMHGPVTSALQALRDPDFEVTTLTFLGRKLRSPHMLVVRSDLPTQSLQELQNAEGPFKVGGLGHLMLVVPAIDSLGIPVEYVTGYNSASETSGALRRGDIDLIQHGQSVPQVISGVTDGAFTPIMVYANQPPDYAPNTLTADEAGYSEVKSLAGLTIEVIAPPDVPSDRLDGLREAFWQTVTSSEFAQWAEDANQNVNPAKHDMVASQVAQMVRIYREKTYLLSEYMG